MAKRKIISPQSLNSYIKGICDIMRRSGRHCAGNRGEQTD
jgi:hypothetical protein